PGTQRGAGAGGVDPGGLRIERADARRLVGRALRVGDELVDHRREDRRGDLGHAQPPLDVVLAELAGLDLVAFQGGELVLVLAAGGVDLVGHLAVLGPELGVLLVGGPLLLGQGGLGLTVPLGGLLVDRVVAAGTLGLALGLSVRVLTRELGALLGLGEVDAMGLLGLVPGLLGRELGLRLGRGLEGGGVGAQVSALVAVGR